MNTQINNILVLDSIDSTNNYANRLISAGTAQNGTVVLAHYQEEGRGQRNNYWESAPRQNILSSLVVMPTFLSVTKQFYLSMVASLALVQLLNDKGAGVTIKWPNDIYAGDSKIAGMLIETAVKGDALYSAVIGIGLNLNQTEFSSRLPNPVSLKNITGNDYDVVKTTMELWTTFNELYRNLEAGHFNVIERAYLNHLYRQNTWALYRNQDGEFEGRIAGTGEYGQLLVEDRTGALRSYMFKEIEFVL